MKILGVTGSIGMGKSTVTAQLALLGAKTLSADRVAHQLLSPGGRAEAQVCDYFPEAKVQGGIDRMALGKLVFASDEKRLLLEQILHPLVVEEEERFVQKQRARGAKLVALDIPLLFETGAEARVDVVLVATAPYHLQRRRVLARPGMDEKKFKQILSAQMSNHEKCSRADMVVQTGLGKAYTIRQLMTERHQWYA